MSYPNDVLCLPLNEHEAVYVSGRVLGDHPGEQSDVQPVVSFVYVDGDTAAEWETKCGPIQIHKRARPQADTKTVDRRDAKAGDIILHHIWPYAIFSPLAWSQLAVDREGLPRAFAEGRWEQIFQVLQRFVESRNDADDHE